MSQRAPGSEFQAGVVIAQRYQLLRLLGQGGMGSVWVARHLTLHTDIAIKFIEAEGLRGDMLARFAREAMTAAAAKSSHIVNVIDYGTEERGHPYIAMELLLGEDLAHKITRDKQLSLRETVEVIVQTCRGLSKAHAAGIVHRDIKPENLFLVQEDEGIFIKILDFGIAKSEGISLGSANQTRTGMLLGTPLYMSPEQALGTRSVDFRADLYSLGVVAYTCLAGRPPFQSEGLGELLVMVSSRPPPPIHQFRADLPARVVQWLDQALSKEPEQRFSSAKAMSEALLAAMGATQGIGGKIESDSRTSLPVIEAESALARPPVIKAEVALARPPGSAVETAVMSPAVVAAEPALPRPEPPSPRLEPESPGLKAPHVPAPHSSSLVATARAQTDDPVPMPPRTSIVPVVVVVSLVAALAAAGIYMTSGTSASKESAQSSPPVAPSSSPLPAGSPEIAKVSLVPSPLDVPSASPSSTSTPSAVPSASSAPRLPPAGNAPRGKKVDLGKYGVP